MTIDMMHFKKKLEEERTLLISEMNKMGRKDPLHAGTWDAKPDAVDVDRGDESDVADKLATFEDNTALINELDARYREVEAALLSIEKGTYGVCTVCNAPIEHNRLEANPAATTCIAHK